MMCVIFGGCSGGDLATMRSRQMQRVLRDDIQRMVNECGQYLGYLRSRSPPGIPCSTFQNGNACPLDRCVYAFDERDLRMRCSPAPGSDAAHHAALMDMHEANIAGFVAGGLHIGCNDTEQEGTFVWPDGSSCADRRPTFSDWSGAPWYDIPGNSSEDSGCVISMFAAGDGNWTARPCDTERHGFICDRGGEYYSEPAMSPSNMLGDEYFITRPIFDHGTATLTSF